MPWQHHLLHPDVRREVLGMDLEQTVVGIQASGSDAGVLYITLFYVELSESRDEVSAISGVSFLPCIEAAYLPQSASSSMFQYQRYMNWSTPHHHT